MKNIIKPLTVLSLIATLSACNIDSEYTLYSSDLKAVADDNETVFAPGKIMITVNDCEENHNEIMDIVNRYYDVTSNAECDKVEFEEFLVFTISSPTIPYGTRLPENIPTGISVKKEDDGTYGVYAQVEEGRWLALKSEVKNMNSTVNLSIRSFTVNLNNDERSAITFKAPSVRINGTPMIHGHGTLNRRDEAIIEFSDVFVEQLTQQNEVQALKVSF